MEKIMKEENDWDHNEEVNVVEDPVVCVSREEVLQALNELKTAKDPGPSDVSMKLIAASGEIGIEVMAEMSESTRWIRNAS